MTTPTKTPARTLAAVLRVLVPSRRWKPQWTYSGGVVKEFKPKDSGFNLYKAYSKDDLARVVAMLTEEQVVRFEVAMNHLLRGDGGPHNPVSAYDAITATASVWLAALAAATGVEL